MRSRKVYVDFSRRLQAANLLDFCRAVRRRVGCLSAWKMPGAQRPAIDARIPNCVFEIPDPAQLASGACFASPQLDSGPPLGPGWADTVVASVPDALRELFDLDRIRAQRSSG